MPKCAILKVHLKAILKRKEKPKSKLRLPRVTMGSNESLNQSLQGSLEKIGYMSSNEPSGNCCKVPNKYLLRHVLGGQNGGSTLLSNGPMLPEDVVFSEHLNSSMSAWRSIGSSHTSCGSFGLH